MTNLTLEKLQELKDDASEIRRNAEDLTLKFEGMIEDAEMTPKELFLNYEIRRLWADAARIRDALSNLG